MWSLQTIFSHDQAVSCIILWRNKASFKCSNFPPGSSNSQSCYGWKRLLRSPINLTLPGPPLNCVPKITTPTHFLNTPRDGDPTASQGTLFQFLTALSVKEFSEFLAAMTWSPQVPNLTQILLDLCVCTWMVCKHGHSDRVPSCRRLLFSEIMESQKIQHKSSSS